MKFQAQSSHILPSAALASRFTGRGSLPSLSTILIVADSNAVLLRATNLECGVEVSFPAKVTKSGTVAVSGAIFSGFMQNNSGKMITVELVDTLLKLESDRAKASLKTVSSDDFPTLPRVSGDLSFTIKAPDLIRLLKSVSFCAATSTVKPELQGVYVTGGTGKLTAAATDSFRLAEKTVPLKSRGSIAPLIVPARNIVELTRILEGAVSDVVVYFNQNQLSTQIENVYYTTRLIDGSFPNYRQIIPKQFSTEAVVLREDFLQALKSLQLFSDKFLQTSLAGNPKQKTLELSSRNSDVGEEQVALPSAVSGEEVRMNFNSRYLADGASALSGESLRLSFSGAGKPLVIKDASDESYLYLAMPMNR